MKDADDDGIVDREVTTTNLKDMVLDRNEDRNIQNNNKNKFDVYIVQCREIKKYGLGYQLSDRSFGVCFNDSSKILQSQPNKFFYIESKDDGDYYEANDPKFFRVNQINFFILNLRMMEIIMKQMTQNCLKIYKKNIIYYKVL